MIIIATTSIAWSGPAQPKAVISKVNAGVVEALKTPDVQKRMENYGVDASASTPEQFAAFIRSETVRWAKVVKAAGIPPQ